MKDHEMRDYVSERVLVEHVQVAEAKSFALSYLARLSEDELAANHRGAVKVEHLWLEFMEAQGVSAPWLFTTGEHSRVGRNAALLDWQSPGLTDRLDATARVIVLVVAMQEAVSELVHAGVLAFQGTWSAWDAGTVTAYYQGGTGPSFGVRRLHSSYPEAVFRPQSKRRIHDPVVAAVADADMLLVSVPMPDLHPGVRDALVQAVACFRRDLFLPCLAMLAAAADGMWVEAGRALVPAAARRDRNVEAAEKVILSDDEGLARRAGAVASLFERADLFGHVHTAVGFRHLREPQQWTDVLRDRRNVLHWGVSATTPNTYATVATMLQAAPLHFRSLVAVRRAAHSPTANVAP
jgi:hypothetical protein